MEISDRIHLQIAGPDDVLAAARHHDAFIKGETLAIEMMLDGDATDAEATKDVDIDGRTVSIGVRRSSG